MNAIVQYTFSKTSPKHIHLAMSIIFIPILLTIKPYISLCIKTTKTKIRIITNISETASIREIDLNVKTYAIRKKKIERDWVGKVEDRKNIMSRWGIRNIMKKKKTKGKWENEKL